jgi:peptide/nickel transport system ATP-binding protein
MSLANKPAAPAMNHSAQLAGNAQDDLLRITDARIWYKTVAGEAKVVDGVDVTIKRNEVFGLAGESGCGKSTLVEGVLRLIKAPGYIRSGQSMFFPKDKSHVKGNGAGDCVDLFNIPFDQLRPLRWRNIAYIPQGAMNSLNPVMRIEDQITDAIIEHTSMPKRMAQEKMLERLTMVGLPPSVARMYPHQLSGGMKQRVTIAASVTLSPDLLVADEPTTALDVNVQRAILQELKDIRQKLGLTVVYVSHDMAVHAELADRMGIMYAGAMMEIGTTTQIFKNPLHPYTQGLIRSIPDIHKPRVRVEGIPGLAPSPLNWPVGCRFHPRCPFAKEICKAVEPKLSPVRSDQVASGQSAEGRLVACHIYTTNEWTQDDLLKGELKRGDLKP